MEDRFDRLENMIGDLGKNLSARIDARGQALGARIDEQGQALARIDAQGQTLCARIDEQGQALARIDAQGQTLGSQLAELAQRVGVLHEDVKADFRFSLEARDGLKEQVDRKFEDQARVFREELAPIRDALRIRASS